MNDEEDEEDNGMHFHYEEDPESSLHARPSRLEEEETEEVPELPSFRNVPSESSLDNWDYYCQPGTTPPKCERQLKQERRANKHKRSPALGEEDRRQLPLYKSYSTADMDSDSSFHLALQQRRSTVPDVPPFTGRERKRRGSGRIQPGAVKDEVEAGKGGKEEVPEKPEKSIETTR